MYMTVGRYHHNNLPIPIIGKTANDRLILIIS